MMAEVDGALIMSILQAIRADTAEIRQDTSDLKFGVHVLEDQNASTVMSLSGINHRLDRVQADVTIIKRRLDLVDAE
jgi:hypothetical protein